MQPDHDGSRAPVAVVVGVDVNGLGVVRSLGKAGVPTIVLDTDLEKATSKTRFGTKILVPALCGVGFVEALLRVAESLQDKPVLFLTQEDSVETVATAQDRLAGSFRFSMPGRDVMRTLMDKSLFQSVAEEQKSPIPRSVRLTADIAPGAIEALRFPCVLKPLTKDEAYSARFKKAYKVSSAGEVAELWTQMGSVVSEVIVQEWIEGADSDVYFCLQYRHASSPSVSFVGRKVCQWPPLVGGTASCIPAPDEHDELVALTDKFFDAVGFVGLGSMEYKRDTRDGRFYMVEPTVGRTDYQEEVATLNGVNIPYAAYCGEIGRPFPAVTRVQPARAWRDSLAYKKARATGAADPLSSISPNARVVDAYLRANDPLPVLFMALEPFQRRLRRLTGGH